MDALSAAVFAVLWFFPWSLFGLALVRYLLRYGTAALTWLRQQGRVA